MADSNSDIKKVSFITMSDVNYDARTLNIINYLKDKVKITLFGFAYEQDVLRFASKGIKVIPIKPPKVTKASKIWSYFNSELLKHQSYYSDIFWASDFFSLKSAIKFAHKHKSKVFYDSREIYSKINSLKNRKIKQFIQTHLEKYWVKKVDKIIVTGELDKEYLTSHFSVNKPYYILMNLPYYTQNLKSNLIRDKYQIPKTKTILIYQGMLSEGRGLNKIVSIMNKLDDFILVLLGEGILKQSLEDMVYINGIEDKVKFPGIVPYEDLLNWTSSADIGLNLIEDSSFSYRLALPNKMFEYCMVGVPVLSSNLPAISKIYDEFQIGEIIEPNCSTEELLNILTKMIQQNNYENYRQECKKAAEKYNYQNQFKVINNIFDLNY